MPTVSVVIVSHNEGGLLRKTVDSFTSCKPAPDEIVVVDDASTDSSTAFLEKGYRDVVLLKPAENLGISQARNYGAGRVTGDLVVFSDAHVEVTDGWIGPLADALADPEIGEVAPTVGWLDGGSGRGHGFTWRTSSLKMSWLYEEKPEPADVPFICGCFLAMRREVFSEVGGFDPGMSRWGFEDAELSLRLWLQGYRCQSVSRSFISHLFRTQFPYQVDQAGIDYNALRLVTVHFDEAAAERVVRDMCSNPAFGRAWARLLNSDTWARRDLVSVKKKQDFRGFLDRFEIGFL